ncbi:hypothetical protein FOMPIDRAFT_92812 [Fomitopsis schrenkii]|uniref:Uncharacterized protein n=1 Tax=Fomitopsis schrenkii TaxID=2126942 RepID=S8DVQ3_FOMSC|nr:hypothetical protein FOMPIDRAFT_92812 [Fomitopsis schrenkii]
MDHEAVVLHESAKKIGTHCVSVGEMKASPAEPLKRVHHIDSGANPYITFHFRYGPREMLRAQAIDVGPKPLVAQPPAVAEASTFALGFRRTGSVIKAPSSRHTDISSGSLGRRLEAVKPHVLKDEPDEDSDSDACLRAIQAQMRTLPEQLDCIQAQMRTLQEQLDCIESKKKQSGRYGSAKRERSPIRAIHSNGAIIDLTDD